MLSQQTFLAFEKGLIKLRSKARLVPRTYGKTGRPVIKFLYPQATVTTSGILISSQPCPTFPGSRTDHILLR